MAQKFSFSRCLAVVALALGVSGAAFAADTLITMPGPKGNIASGFKDAGGGKYEFTLDKAKGFQGKDVRSSLKKDAAYGKTITDVKTTDTVVTVSYTGDVNAFLNTVAGIEIKKSGGDAGISVASTVSDGGIRAKAAVRSPVANEVMAHVVKVHDNAMVEIKIVELGAGVSGITKNQRIKVEAKGAGLKKEDKGKTVYVMMGAKKGDYYETSKVDFK